jgi:hypothetical protein
VVIVALLIAWFAVLAALLYHETSRGRQAGDHLAALAWHAGRHLWSMLRLVAVFVLVYVEMVRHGGSRP